MDLFQSGNIKVCDIDPVVKEKVEKFRLRKEKTIAAIVRKFLTNMIFLWGILCKLGFGLFLFCKYNVKKIYSDVRCVRKVGLSNAVDRECGGGVG